MLDPIQLERVNGGRTRASVQLMSGLDVFGAWAAGDAQAFRALIVALMEVADGATARVDRANRLTEDLTAGNRVLRDQLREALDDLEAFRSDRDEERTDVDMTEVIRERDQLRGAHAAEKRRADEAVAAREEYADEAVKEFNEMREQLTPLRMQVLALTHERDQLLAAQADHLRVSAVHQQFWQKAVDAANAADQAFEEAKWKEGGRYLKLANTWVGLLNAVATSPQTPPMETQ